jgi:NitT/TauT family transport system substrate-binding protein
MVYTNFKPTRRTLLKTTLGLTATLASPALLTRAWAKTPLTMQFDWKFNVQFAGCFMAKEAGLYDAAELDVMFKEWTDGVNVIEDAAKLPMTLACAEQNLIIAAQANGSPVKALATMFQASPYGLMSTPDKPITTLADLKGKTIGVHIDGLKVMDLVMGVNGIAKDDIKIVEIDYDKKFDRVVSGEFAAVQCYAVDEPVGVEAQFKIKPTVMKLSDFGFTSTAQTIVASDTTLAAEPDAVKAFLKATFEGWKLALTDIPAAASIIATKYAVPGSKYTDLAYQTGSLTLIKDYVELGVGADKVGVIDLKAYSAAADLMLKYGIVAALPDMTSSIAAGMFPAS